MAIATTYTNLRDKLASILDTVVEGQEVVIVRRRGSRDVALIPAAELASLEETAHLLRSPRNAQRLLTALRRANRQIGKPASLDDLRRGIGLGKSR
jgi:antitoxin YefM